MAEEHRQMRRCISQRSAKQNALFSFPSTRSALNIIEVVVAYRLELEIGRSGKETEG